MKKSVTFLAAASLFCALSSAQILRPLPPNSTTNARAVGNIVMPIVPLDVCTASNSNCFTSSSLPGQQAAPFLGYGGSISTFIFTAPDTIPTGFNNVWVVDGRFGVYAPSTWSAIELANGNGTRYLVSSLQGGGYKDIVFKFADGSTCSPSNGYFPCVYTGKFPIGATATAVYPSGG